MSIFMSCIYAQKLTCEISGWVHSIAYTMLPNALKYETSYTQRLYRLFFKSIFCNSFNPFEITSLTTLHNPCNTKEKIYSNLPLIAFRISLFPTLLKIMETFNPCLCLEIRTMLWYRLLHKYCWLTSTQSQKKKIRRWITQGFSKVRLGLLLPTKAERVVHYGRKRVSFTMLSNP